LSTRIYFDNASTTPILKEVSHYMAEVNETYYGNPSSIHFYGRQSKIIVEDARTLIANGLGASTGEIFFTSGATEANNMALYCSVRDLGIKKILSSPTEHHCNLHMFDYLQKHKLASVEMLDVDQFGHIDYEALDEKLSNENEGVMLSLMHGNNELGTIHNMDRLGEVCKKYNVLFHSDAAQTIGKIPIDLSNSNVGFIAGSAHKFYGPKGVGFIYINGDNLIKPLIHGGDQERGMRSGTENLYGIAGMSKAFELALSEMNDRTSKIEEISNLFINRLTKECHDIRINGSQVEQLKNIVSISFPHTDKAEMLMMNLDILGICASSGSACASGVENDSHVLEAIKHDPKRKTVRFSFSHLNSLDEVNTVVDKIKTVTPLK